MSIMARSGRCSRTRSSSPGASCAWPMTSNPDRWSRLAIPSRSRVSSSARTMRLLVSPTMSVSRRHLVTVLSITLPASSRWSGGGGLREMGATGTRDVHGGGSLARRTAAVSTLLSVVIGSAFLLLALAIEELRRSESRANHALEVLVAANRLERVAIDVETTQRGFVITGEPRFLRPWHQARTEFAQQAAILEALAREGDLGQGRRAHQITEAGKSYIKDYSIPLVAVAQRDLESARTATVTREGERRVNELRSRFEQFRARENEIFAAGHDRAEDSAELALVAAS